MNRILQISKIFALGIASILAGCDLQENKTEYNNNASGEKQNRYAPVSQQRTSEKRQLVQIPIKIQSDDGSASLLEDESFGLTARASATSYKLSIADCLSGYSQNNITAATVYVYQFDSGCTVRLTELVFDSVTYDLTHADADNWSGGLDVGDTAILVDTNATAGAGNSTDVEQMEAVISSTLTTGGVQGGDVITIYFRQIVKNTDDNTQAVSVVRDGGHAVTVAGQKAPNFTIESVTLKNLDGSGTGIWEFRMLCGNALTSGDTKCDDVLLTDIKYALVIDTFSDTMNRTQLDDAIAGGGSYDAGTGISVIAGDINAHAGADNGGFSTKGASGTTYVSLRDTARTNIDTDLQMILILEANGSYVYYNVDITPVTN